MGTRYHVGIGVGSSIYGYCLTPGTKFEESTDLHAKDLLTQYSSPNLIDRDFVNYPRVTDGDFSGGALQTVFIDPKKYFDSDLDIHTPGYLILRPGYARATKSSITPVGQQVVPFNGDYWFTFGDAAKNFYSANGGFTHVAGSQPVALDSDGQYLYVGYAGGLDRYPASGSDVGAAVQVATALNGTARQWWVVNLGTQGVFAYYAIGNNTLYKIDLTVSFPVAAGSQAAVALGSNNIYITDICAYQSGLAILTNDVSSGNGFDIWFHDGSNLTRIIRVEGYRARGMCNSLGALYVAAESVSNHTPPILARIGYGVFSIVAKAGSPFFTSTAQYTLQPRASSHYVYWPVLNPSINGITGSAVGQVLEYNALTSAIAALPANDTLDFASQVGSTINNGLRAIAVQSESLASTFFSGSSGYLQYQVSAFGTAAYRSTGWLVSSRLDFNTPSIPKMFRRVIVTHKPLAAGEAILVQAWVDKDPLSFTTTATQGSSATQYTAQQTNSTTGSVQTVLTLPSATIGNSLFFALRLTAGTNQLTSPTVFYVGTEVGVPWTWKATLDCSSKRKDAKGQSDTQGARGVDLYGLLHDAWENALAVTLYHPNGNTYTTVMEGASFTSSNPLFADTSNQPKDYEASVSVLLRQSTV